MADQCDWIRCAFVDLLLRLPDEILPPSVVFDVATICATSSYLRMPSIVGNFVQCSTFSRLTPQIQITPEP